MAERPAPRVCARYNWFGMVRTLGEAAGFGAFLSFSLIGFNDQEKIEVPGTGFRIAPGLGLTAAHVANEFFTKLALPEGRPLPRQQKRYEGVEVRAAEQDPSGITTELNGWWYVEGFFNSKVTDICLLSLSPGNDAARRADERGGYLRWSLSAPSVAQRLYAFGYIKDELRSQTTAGRTDFEVEYTVSTQRVIVTNVFPAGRREVPLEVPAILGPSSFFDPSTAPSFEVEGEIAPSMSGSAAFNSDLLYGVVSRGLTERGEDGVTRDVAGIVMLLKPLLQMGEVSLGEGYPRIRIADLIDQGKINLMP